MSHETIEEQDNASIAAAIKVLRCEHPKRSLYTAETPGSLGQQSQLICSRCDQDWELSEPGGPPLFPCGPLGA